MVLPSAAIVRRDAIADLHFPEFDSTCGDWDFFARLSRRHGGVFVTEETTLNRSHEDPWRLTRIDTSVQTRRRIALIRRLWRSDAAFMRDHGHEVDAVEAGCLRKLAKGLLTSGDSKGARTALAELESLGAPTARRSDLVLRLLSHTPVAYAVASIVRGLRIGWSRLARGNPGEAA
jgi:hypothetical protein